jgi:hypothetical protein
MGGWAVFTQTRISEEIMTSDVFICAPKGVVTLKPVEPTCCVAQRV